MTEQVHPPAAALAAAANGGDDGANDLLPPPPPFPPPPPPPPQGLALALPGRYPRGDSSSSDEESSSEDDDEEENARREQFAGPLDAEACTLGGAGARGGEAGAVQKLYVFSRDSRGVKVREGGAYVQAWLQPPARGASATAGAEVEKIEASILDAGDGSYAVEFIAPRKGNFDLHVMINGSAVGGGAFPLFFSARSGKGGPLALPPAPLPGALTAATTTTTTPQEQTLPPPPPPAPRSVLGAAAAASEVPWPSEEEGQGLEDLERSLLLGGVHASITEQQLRQLCAFAGAVESAGFVGKVTPHNAFSSVVVAAAPGAAAATPAAAAALARTHLGGGRFALVRFSAPASPRIAAPALDGQTVAGRVVRAEVASSTRPVALAVAAARLAALPGAARDLREAAATASVVDRLDSARAAAKQAAVRASAGVGGDKGAGFGRSGDYHDRRPRSRREEEKEQGGGTDRQQQRRTVPSSATTTNTQNTQTTSSNKPSSSIEQSKLAALERLAALQARLTGGGTGVAKAAAAAAGAATASATAAAAPLPPQRRENSSPPDKNHHQTETTNINHADDDDDDRSHRRRRGSGSREGAGAGSGGDDGEGARSLRGDRGAERRRSRSRSPERQRQRRN